MHYKNGKPAQVGDIILAANNGVPFTGVVVKTNAQSDACNLIVIPVTGGGIIWVTAKDAVHADDALNPVPAPAAAATVTP